MPIDPARIVAAARAWLGTPFQHQGRLRGKGVDCGGLVIGVGRELGLAIDEPPAYSMSPDPGLFPSVLVRYCERVGLADFVPGDILHFSFAGEPRHVGIATDVGVIHAWAKPGKVVEHRLDAIWRRRLRGAWRIV